MGYDLVRVNVNRLFGGFQVGIKKFVSKLHSKKINLVLFCLNFFSILYFFFFIFLSCQVVRKMKVVISLSQLN